MANHRTRARDADRDEAVEFLSAGYADGQLTFEEFQKRSDRVVTSRTLGEIDAYIQDLQVPGQQRKPPTLSRLVEPNQGGAGEQRRPDRRRLLAFVAVGLAVAVGAGVAGSITDGSDDTVSADVADEPAIDALDPDGFEQIVGLVEERTGTTKVREMLMFPSGAGNVSVSVEGSATRTASYTFDGQEFAEEPSLGTSYTDLDVIDLAAIDASSLPAAVDSARSLIEDPTEVLLHVIHQSRFSDRDYCYTVRAENEFGESGTAFVACDGRITDTSLSPDPG